MNSPVLTFTNTQLQKLSVGLASLDGIRTSPNDFEPFRFSPDTTWKIASNQTIIADHLQKFERARKSLAVQHKVSEGMKITPENSVQVNAFMQELDVLTEKVIEVSGLEKIGRDKLNIGFDESKKQNAIAPSVLVNLMPLLE